MQYVATEYEKMALKEKFKPRQHMTLLMRKQKKAKIVLVALKEIVTTLAREKNSLEPSG